MSPAASSARPSIAAPAPKARPPAHDLPVSTAKRRATDKAGTALHGLGKTAVDQGDYPRSPVGRQTARRHPLEHRHQRRRQRVDVERERQYEKSGPIERLGQPVSTDPFVFEHLPHGQTIDHDPRSPQASGEIVPQQQPRCSAWAGDSPPAGARDRATRGPTVPNPPCGVPHPPREAARGDAGLRRFGGGAKGPVTPRPHAHLLE